LTDSIPNNCPYRLRLCHLKLNGDADGYGFMIFTGTAPVGQFIGEVDHQSPAERAGLRTGDRVVEVNGVNVETDSHCEVHIIFSLFSVGGVASLSLALEILGIWIQQTTLNAYKQLFVYCKATDYLRCCQAVYISCFRPIL